MTAPFGIGSQVWPGPAKVTEEAASFRRRHDEERMRVREAL